MKRDEFIIGKWKLFVPEVEFCGHILGGTRRPAPGKLHAIEKWEVPKTVTALRAFLGFTNYYSFNVKDYAKIVARLMDKLKVPRELGKKIEGPHNLGRGRFERFCGNNKGFV